MARTRAALLAATGECLGRYGVRKTTMVDVAERSRVAKATLYNHFRTKDDLLVAYVEDRVVCLIRTAALAAAGGLGAALASVSAELAVDPALRRAATEEPAVLAPLAVPSDARGWGLARDGVRTVLAAARIESGEREVELVLRWATSQLLWPADPGSVGLLVAALSVVPAVEDVPAAAAAPHPSVGWPR